MTKKPNPQPSDDELISQVASLMGKRSAAARRKKWGDAEFKKKMQQWGKLGGRPRKNDNDGKSAKKGEKKVKVKKVKKKSKKTGGSRA